MLGGWRQLGRLSWSPLYCSLKDLPINKMCPTVVGVNPLVKDEGFHLDRPLWFTVWDIRRAM